MLIPWLPERPDAVETLPLLPLEKLQWTFLSLLPYFMRLRKYSVGAVSERRCENVKTHPLSYDSLLAY